MKPKASSLKSMAFPSWVGRDRRARRPIRRQLSVLRLPAVLCLLTSVLCQSANAAGIASLHSLSTGTVSITNTHKNSSWVPVALLFQFNAPVTGTITVTRQTVGQTFRLATVDLSGNQYAVWLPEASIPFNLNDVLSVTSSATNGTVEIIRKGD